MKAVLLLLLALALPAHAEDNAAGDFDYFVMALTWSPNWCALEGDARDDDQCDARHAYGFTLHGLWPQFETGYPSGCRTTARDPSRAETAAMTTPDREFLGECRKSLGPVVMAMMAAPMPVS